MTEDKDRSTACIEVSPPCSYSTNICVHTYGTNHPQLKQCTHVARVCCVCHTRGILSLWLHTRAKLVTDTQVHANTLFAHVVTCTYSFSTRINMHTQFLPMHEYEHAHFLHAYRLLTLFQLAANEPVCFFPCYLLSINPDSYFNLLQN